MKQYYCTVIVIHINHQKPSRNPEQIFMKMVDFVLTLISLFKQ